MGRVLGAHARPGDVVLLVGGLGAGKTCLTQGILWGLGVDEHARSPTFVLVSQYSGRIDLYHVDLYRLDRVRDIDDLGLDEFLLGDGMCVVEWADKAPHIFLDRHVKVRLDYLDDNTRRITVAACGDGYDDVMRSLESLAVRT